MLSFEVTSGAAGTVKNISTPRCHREFLMLKKSALPMLLRYISREGWQVVPSS